jgi:hypothetical protein
LAFAFMSRSGIDRFLSPVSHPRAAELIEKADELDKMIDAGPGTLSWS